MMYVRCGRAGAGRHVRTMRKGTVVPTGVRGGGAARVWTRVWDSNVRFPSTARARARLCTMSARTMRQGIRLTGVQVPTARAVQRAHVRARARARASAVAAEQLVLARVRTGACASSTAPGEALPASVFGGVYILSQDPTRGGSCEQPRSQSPGRGVDPRPPDLRPERLQVLRGGGLGTGARMGREARV